jgi:prolyl-tRNA editing enzyme YbaK/EbsC (Cys-tRNA(Pro) deacylase)
MWPEEVERIAIFLRASGAEGSLEELPAEGDKPPGVLVTVAAFQCDGRTVVTLIPTGRTTDERKVSRVAGCDIRGRVTTPSFPYQGASVFLDIGVLSASTAWIELGTGNHILGLAPSELARLAEAETSDLVAENENGGG